MRALVIVVVLACACAHADLRKVHRASEVATAGALLGLLACGTAAAVVPSHERPLMTIGLVFVPISVVGALLYIATDRDANMDDSPPLTGRDRQRAAAWQLTKQAADAARAGDCALVQAIAPRVYDLDNAVHSTVFVHDVAIERCMSVR